jgi:DNA-binding LacI/PurR family transcriptional regulator/GAF domain-containing protein
MEAAQVQGANLICFPGQSLDSPRGFEAQANALYDLVSGENVDGLVISSTLGEFVGAEGMMSFCGRYPQLPVVGAGMVLEGVPGVVVDNYSGVRDLIVHLVEVHSCRRIAFIRGPEGSPDVGQRYQAYTDVLTEYGLPLDSGLTVSGDHQLPSGVAAIRLLMDKRRVDFDAVVANNDNMALGALQELLARDVRVPEDVAVVGFDDIEESKYAVSPLTTVRYPVDESGRRATEMLVARLRNEEVPERVVLPANVVVRRSCGCPDQAVAEAVAGSVRLHESGATSEVWEGLDARREHGISEMFQALGISSRQDLDELSRTAQDGASADAVSGQVRQLWDAFVAELRGEAPGGFLSALGRSLLRTVAMGDGVSVWQGAVSALRTVALPCLEAGELLSRAEDLWHQARLTIGRMALRIQAEGRLQAERRAQTLRTIGQALITTFDMDDLLDALVRNLPQLGIPSCYLSLYDGREQSTLMLAYVGRRRIELASGGQDFLSRKLVPGDLALRRLNSGGRYTMVAEPLYVREDQLGLALFEVGPREGAIYDVLRGQIANALKGALLVQQVEERSRALQEANYAVQRRAIHLEASAEVAQAIISIFDVDELLRKTVDLVRDQFGFYHAGIFLLDEAGEWAVLREATGEAGAQMKAEGHRLSVGETSMVGWTALHRQPRIALDVGQDAVRFANPLLPDTRSEMTLPLVVGDRLIGVLNVQSTEEAAFDDDDVRVLQSMANQIAVAIENARRVSDETLLLETTSPIYRASRRLARATTVSEVADAIIASVAETGADGCTVVEFEFTSDEEPVALLYRGVWRRDREVQFQPGTRLAIADSPFPFDMVSTLWSVADVDRDSSLPQSARQVFRATGVRALTNIPLYARGKVIGQVVVLRAIPGPFSDAALRLYEALSDQAAVALERARLWEEAQRRAERERRTRQMIDHIRRAVDVERALQTTAEELSRAMRVSQVSVELSLEGLDDRA